MKAPQEVFNVLDFHRTLEGKTERKSFAKTMEGIHSSRMTIKSFEFGEQTQGHIYRRFFYNKYGSVIKKICYTSEGQIEMKEEYHYNKKNRIYRSKFISDNSIIRESYVYHKEDGYLRKYYFWNTNWKHTKKEDYEVEKYVDADGADGFRKTKKTSYGLLGNPELITHYLYNDNTNRYRFRHVTNADEELILSLLYTYNENGFQIGLHGFSLTPAGIADLMSTNKKWEQESHFRTIWTYDESNNPISFIRDERSADLNLIKNSSLFGVKPNGRVITQKTTSEYKCFEDKNYLIRTTEWLPRYDEPFKAVKEYVYYDKEGKVINPEKDM